MDELAEKLKGRKVLIVDDDIRNTFALSTYLESMGLDIVTAENGYRALEILHWQPREIGIILMDMMMPEMDGYEAIDRIKKTDEISGIPIISVTANAMKGDREKCLQAGATDYVSKPVVLNELIGKMTSVID